MEAQALLPPPPALEPPLLLVRHTSCLPPVPLRPSTLPPTRLMWPAGKVSSATSACLSTQPALAATWRLCKAMAAWPTVPTDASRLRGVLWLLLSPPNPSYPRGLLPWLLLACRAALMPHWPAAVAAAAPEARWMPTAVSSAPSQPRSSSTWCRLEVAPALPHHLHLEPPLLPPTCSAGATTMCNRAPTTLSPCTTLTTCTDTTSPPLLAWLPALKSPREVCSAPHLLPGPSLSASICPMEAWTLCTWSATLRVVSRAAALVTDVSMDPPLRCPCTWCSDRNRTSAKSSSWKADFSSVKPGRCSCWTNIFTWSVNVLRCKTFHRRMSSVCKDTPPLTRHYSGSQIYLIILVLIKRNTGQQPDSHAVSDRKQITDSDCKMRERKEPTCSASEGIISCESVMVQY